MIVFTRHRQNTMQIVSDVERLRSDMSILDPVTIKSATDALKYSPLNSSVSSIARKGKLTKSLQVEKSLPYQNP